MYLREHLKIIIIMNAKVTSRQLLCESVIIILIDFNRLNEFPFECSI